MFKTNRLRSLAVKCGIKLDSDDYYYNSYDVERGFLAGYEQALNDVKRLGSTYDASREIMALLEELEEKNKYTEEEWDS